MARQKKASAADIRVVFDPDTAARLAASAAKSERTLQQEVRFLVKCALACDEFESVKEK